MPPSPPTTKLTIFIIKLNLNTWHSLTHFSSTRPFLFLSLWTNLPPNWDSYKDNSLVMNFIHLQFSLSIFFNKPPFGLQQYANPIWSLCFSGNCLSLLIFMLLFNFYNPLFYPSFPSYFIYWCCHQNICYKNSLNRFIFRVRILTMIMMIMT